MIRYSLPPNSDRVGYDAICDFTQEHGSKVTLGDVAFPNPGQDPNWPAGIAYDRDVTVEIGPQFNPNIYGDQLMSGLLACRAVVVGPGEASPPLLGDDEHDGGLMVRLRLTFDEPETPFSVGGPFMALTSLRIGKLNIDRFQSFFDHRDNLRLGRKIVNVQLPEEGQVKPTRAKPPKNTAPPEPPIEPFIKTYEVQAPPFTPRANDKSGRMPIEGARREVVYRLQKPLFGANSLLKYPERILDAGDLARFAIWFTDSQE
jgi:hypothetical protein